MSKKKVANVYLWCSKLGEKQKKFGSHQIDMRNCVVKVEGTKKCTFQGKPAKCVETAFAYELPPYSYPKYRKVKK